MKLFQKSYDGGDGSGVTGYWLIECKSLFSIVLLHFSPGSRDAFHSHAFNALTWWLKGEVTEEFNDQLSMMSMGSVTTTLEWKPSWKPKWTPKYCFHKIIAGKKGAWALSFRGPWDPTWFENKNGQTYELGHGRVRINALVEQDSE
jgi:hypothetical protein